MCGMTEFRAKCRVAKSARIGWSNWLQLGSLFEDHVCTGLCPGSLPLAPLFVSAQSVAPAAEAAVFSQPPKPDFPGRPSRRQRQKEGQVGHLSAGTPAKLEGEAMRDVYVRESVRSR